MSLYGALQEKCQRRKIKEKVCYLFLFVVLLPDLPFHVKTLLELLHLLLEGPHTVLANWEGQSQANGKAACVRSVPGASSSAPRGSCPSLLGGLVQPESCCLPAVAGDPPARCAAWTDASQRNVRKPVKRLSIQRVVISLAENCVICHLQQMRRPLQPTCSSFADHKNDGRKQGMKTNYCNILCRDFVFPPSLHQKEPCRRTDDL